MMLQVNQGRINSLGGFAGAALVVTLTRVSPRALDSDNLAYAFKAVRDEVAAYFGVNDNDPRRNSDFEHCAGCCSRTAAEGNRGHHTAAKYCAR